MSLFGGKRGDGSEPAGEQPPGTWSEVDPTSGRGDPPADQLARGRGAIVSGEQMANIGKSVSIKGDLTGNEDLVIEGNVEGKIELPSSQLTIGPNGNVAAEVHAKSVVVVGRLTGNVNATDRVELQGSGVLEGDVKAPRLVIAEGAVLNGAVEMGTRKKAETSPLPRSAAAGAERAGPA